MIGTPPELDNQFCDFIAANKWKKATSPQYQDAPHEYVVKEKSSSEIAFEWAVVFIRTHGYRRKWGGRYYTYYEVDGNEYWTMGSPLEMTIILNRAAVTEPTLFNEVKESDEAPTE